MTPTQLIENIEKEFDLKTGIFQIGDGGMYTTPDWEKIKSHLFSTNIQTLEMLRGRIKGMKNRHYESCDAPFNGNCTCEVAFSWETCKTNIISNIDNIISELKKKI